VAELRSYDPTLWDKLRQALDSIGQYGGYHDLGQRTADTANLVGTAAMFAPGLAIGPATGAVRDGAMASKLKQLYPYAEDFIHPAHGGQRLVQQFADDSATVFNRVGGARRYEPSGYRSMEWMNNAQGGRTRMQQMPEGMAGANEAQFGLLNFLK
jgi:hypothetical protein